MYKSLENNMLFPLNAILPSHWIRLYLDESTKNDHRYWPNIGPTAFDVLFLSLTKFPVRCAHFSFYIFCVIRLQVWPSSFHSFCSFYVFFLFIFRRLVLAAAQLMFFFHCSIWTSGKPVSSRRITFPCAFMCLYVHRLQWSLVMAFFQTKTTEKRRRSKMKRKRIKKNLFTRSHAHRRWKIKCIENNNKKRTNKKRTFK